MAEIKEIQDLHEVPDSQRVKNPRAPFWSQEHWFAYEEMSKWSRENTMATSANREGLVSKAGASPMLSGLIDRIRSCQGSCL